MNGPRAIPSRISRPDQMEHERALGSPRARPPARDPAKRLDAIALVGVLERYLAEKAAK